MNHWTYFLPFSKLKESIKLTVVAKDQTIFEYFVIIPVWKLKVETQQFLTKWSGLSCIHSFLTFIFYTRIFVTYYFPKTNNLYTRLLFIFPKSSTNNANSHTDPRSWQVAEVSGNFPLALPNSIFYNYQILSLQLVNRLVCCILFAERQLNNQRNIQILSLTNNQ